MIQVHSEYIIMLVFVGKQKLGLEPRRIFTAIRTICKDSKKIKKGSPVRKFGPSDSRSYSSFIFILEL